MPHTTRIDMNETTIASGIIPDPASLSYQGSVAQQLEGDIGKLHIDGTAEHVLASAGDVPTDAPKQGVGLR